MRPSSRSRLALAITLVVLGTAAAAFAVADSLTLISSSKVEPHGEAFPPAGDVSDETADAEQGVLGAQASAQDRSAGKNKNTSKAEGKKKKSEAKRGDAADEEVQTQMVAALIPAGSGGGGRLALPCSDTNSCVDRVGRLVTDVTDRIPDLPRLRECTSLIGGDATCFYFGGGNYLVGDGPADGEIELGFCTDSGYYYVSGPSLEGGAGVACPDDGGGGDGTGGGDAPRVHDCTSSSGGDATCFYFGGGNYLVSDPPADGGGELGFCTDSGYYYVSAPSAEGDAGAKCPHARASG